MSKNGIWQLSKISLYYCKNSGSSAGIRKLISYGNLKDFADKNPQILFYVKNRSGKSPFLLGEYINGYKKQIDLSNKSPKQINTFLSLLRNSWGRKATKIQDQTLPTGSKINNYY